MAASLPHIALLWYGDRESRSNVTLEGHRFADVATALQAVAVESEPVVYNDDFEEEVRQQLLDVDGVLVWVNPIEQGRDRTQLDALLREAAARGVFVSTHPDAILKMGTKEVLVQTREMSWGTDTHSYATHQELCEQLPMRLREGQARVLKQ